MGGEGNNVIEDVKSGAGVVPGNVGGYDGTENRGMNREVKRLSLFEERMEHVVMVAMVVVGGE